MEIMDGINWEENYSEENIKDCRYNMDSGYVEVYFSDGDILRIK